MLGRRQDDDDGDEAAGDAVTMRLDDLVCPTCGRDLAPWVTSCPADGATPVDRSHGGLPGVPPIPSHLLAGLDDPDDGRDPDDPDHEEGAAG